MSKQVTAVVVGAGSRGFAYSDYALEFSDKFKVCDIYTTFEHSVKLFNIVFK
jgi:hypothetical protein